jgi:hypothetical protein
MRIVFFIWGTLFNDCYALFLELDIEQIDEVDEDKAVLLGQVFCEGTFTRAYSPCYTYDH